MQDLRRGGYREVGQSLTFYFQYERIEERQSKTPMTRTSLLLVNLNRIKESFHAPNFGRYTQRSSSYLP